MIQLFGLFVPWFFVVQTALIAALIVGQISVRE